MILCCGGVEAATAKGESVDAAWTRSGVLGAVGSRVGDQSLEIISPPPLDAGAAAALKSGGDKFFPCKKQREKNFPR